MSYSKFPLLTHPSDTTREEAVQIAIDAGLAEEVVYYIDILHYTPAQALYEWDI